MRYIDLEKLAQRVPLEWRNKAENAQAEVKAALPADRSKVVSRHSGVWTDERCKELLAAAGARKCWYCESRENRSDAAVDHFRPKGKVAEEDDRHHGYWWLAFNFLNYRYCCTFCNSTRKDRERGDVRGGKQTQFPLLNPEGRVFDEGDCSGERPVLLDPTKAADTLLLYYREDGEVEPRYSDDVAWEKSYRAAQSIGIYNLRHTALVEARLDILNNVREMVRLGKVYYQSWLADGSDEAAFDLVVARLKKLSNPDAEYSAAVRDFLKGFRDDTHPWIDDIC